MLECSETYDDFFIAIGILYKDAVKELLVVPEAMHDEIIGIVHREGHYTAQKTRQNELKNPIIYKILQRK